MVGLTCVKHALKTSSASRRPYLNFSLLSHDPSFIFFDCKGIGKSLYLMNQYVLQPCIRKAHFTDLWSAFGLKGTLQTLSAYVLKVWVTWFNNPSFGTAWRSFRWYSDRGDLAYDCRSFLPTNLDFLLTGYNLIDCFRLASASRFWSAVCGISMWGFCQSKAGKSVIASPTVHALWGAERLFRYHLDTKRALTRFWACGNAGRGKTGSEAQNTTLCREDATLCSAAWRTAYLTW